MTIMQVIVMRTHIHVETREVSAFFHHQFCTLPAFVELHLRQCARCLLGGIGKDEENLWV